MSRSPSGAAALTSHTAFSPKIGPVLVSIADARAIAGLSRSAIYRHMASGHIRAVKSGARTLVVVESLVEYVGSLPRATFRASR
jgi:hypothetical protein